MENHLRGSAISPSSCASQPQSLMDNFSILSSQYEESYKFEVPLPFSDPPQIPFANICDRGCPICSSSSPSQASTSPNPPVRPSTTAKYLSTSSPIHNSPTSADKLSAAHQNKACGISNLPPRPTDNHNLTPSSVASRVGFSNVEMKRLLDTLEIFQTIGSDE